MISFKLVHRLREDDVNLMIRRADLSGTDLTFVCKIAAAMGHAIDERGSIMRSDRVMDHVGLPGVVAFIEDGHIEVRADVADPTTTTARADIERSVLEMCIGSDPMPVRWLIPPKRTDAAAA